MRTLNFIAIRVVKFRIPPRYTCTQLQNISYMTNPGAHDSANGKSNATHSEVIMVHDFTFTFKSKLGFLEYLKTNFASQ